MKAGVSPWSLHGYVVLGRFAVAFSIISARLESPFYPCSARAFNFWQITLRLQKASKLSCYADRPRYERIVGAVLRYDVKRLAEAD